MLLDTPRCPGQPPHAKEWSCPTCQQGWGWETVLNHTVHEDNLLSATTPQCLLAHGGSSMEMPTEGNVDRSLGLRSVCPSITGWSLVTHHCLFLPKVRNHVELSSSRFPSTAHRGTASLRMGPPALVSTLLRSPLSSQPLPPRKDYLFAFLPGSHRHSGILHWEESNRNPSHSGRAGLTSRSLGSRVTLVRAA